MKATVAILLLSLTVSVGCDKETTASFEPEVFTGELTVRRIDQVFTRIDTVELVVDGPSYQLTHIIRASNLCDSRGSQSGFGSNRLSLAPSPIASGGCDNLRVPAGTFKAVFSGDSLILGPMQLEFSVTTSGRTSVETWEYEFRLKE